MNWFDTALASNLLEQERRRVADLLPVEYYPRVLQIGLTSFDFLDHPCCGYKYQALVDTEDESKANHLLFYSLRNALPFSKRSIDLIVLPHTLDFSKDPHAVIREASQVLAPEGCLVITGFNQFSLWGLVRMMKSRSGNPPWSGQFYRLRRVKDWLALLGYDPVAGCFIYYQPPIGSEQLLKKLGFLDKAGDRWWPGLGAVYLLIARKHEIKPNLLEVSMGRWRTMIPGFAQSAAGKAAKGRLRRIT